MAETFSADVIKLNLVTMQSGSVDPSAGGGVAAPIGSPYFRSNGDLWIKIGAGNTAWFLIGGSSINMDVFRYTVTGAEPDLTDFMITLPVARANDTYRIAATLATSTVIVPFTLPDSAAGDRTTTQFRIIGAAPFTAADTIDFFVSNDT